ncbi:hypothetical protein DQE82_18590 [Micromonospora sp. LHW51205]|uniref:condensation domain-containing protein n=1 Tax=Micromonospora sp. LHW51205 TaxID=2248752 RepID=UPI000DEADE94|nr:condensation domain-containing protein [Micromonospora sp. LHW51205]RBQ08457.1 hypothetical protein DQE82_18590 [Micromonospora sp. LHW51205]
MSLRDGEELEIRFRAPSGRTADLTWGQQRMAQLMADLQPNNASLNLKFAHRIKPGLKADEVASAIRGMVEACESARTLFEPDAPSAQQRVTTEGVLHVAVITAVTATFTSALESAAELAGTPFGADDLPVRVGILTDRSGPAFVLLAINHLASDYLGAHWMTWHLRHVLQADFSDGEPSAIHPVDVSHWESSEAGRREGARALLRHERSLARMPQSMLPRLPVEPLHPRYRYVVMQTSAGAWCLSHLAKRHGVSETAVGHAALSLVLAHVSGLSRAHLQVCVSNRAGRDTAAVVGCLTQDVPTCVAIDDADFDALLRRSAGAIHHATLTGRFPHRGLMEVRERVEKRRGFPLDLSYWLNSRLFVPLPAEAPNAARIREEAARTSVRWLGGDQCSTSTLFCYLDRRDDILEVLMLVDTAYVAPAEAEQWLRAFESILVTAVLRPELSADALVAETGVVSFRATDDWVKIDHSWIHLPTTAARLHAALPGMTLRLAVETPGGEASLVAMVASPRSGRETSAPSDTVVVEALRGCRVGMRPHRFVSRAGDVQD